jgi:hypothetical protein
MKPFARKPGRENRRVLLAALLGLVPASRELIAQRAAKCWAGTDSRGDFLWVPCSPVAQSSGPAQMVTCDLDTFGGIRLIRKGQKFEIPADEIWEELTSPSSQGPRVL